MATYLEISEKEGQIDHLQPTLSFGGKTAKIGPADPEITVLREIIKKRRRKKKRKKEINASKISSTVGNLAVKRRKTFGQRTDHHHNRVVCP